jgi:hypothetical protein
LVIRRIYEAKTEEITRRWRNVNCVMGIFIILVCSLQPILHYHNEWIQDDKTVGAWEIQEMYEQFFGI